MLTCVDYSPTTIYTSVRQKHEMEKREIEDFATIGKKTRHLIAGQRLSTKVESSIRTKDIVIYWGCCGTLF